MTVLTPLFLLGLAALAIPILLHLLRRKERRTLVFPALRYLKRTTREHARIVRLRQLLLLALRLTAVLLVALAGARLVLPLGGTDDPPAGLAIVIDNGLTSGAVVGDGRVLDLLAATAVEALDQAGARDQIWLVEAGAPNRASVPLSVGDARAAVQSLEPTHVTPNLLDAVSRAGSLLDAAAPELKEIVVVSDLNPATLPPPGPGVAGWSGRVLVAPPPTASLSSRGVGGLLVSGGLVPRAGELGQLEVQVVGDDVSGSTVRGYVDGRLVGTVGAGPDGSAVIPLPRFAAGWIRGRVEVEPDGLRGDDVRHFALPVIPPPRIEVLGPVAPYIQEALAVLAEAGRILLVADGEGTVEISSGGSARPLSPEKTVILIPPDEAALLPSFNRELAQLRPGWSVEPAPAPIGSVRVDAGTLLEFLPSEIEVREAYEIRRDAEGWSLEQLLSLSGEAPWLVESESAGGTVILIASPMTVVASDLPASASLLPLIEILSARSGTSATPRELLAGQPFALPLGSAAVRLPDGTTRPVVGIVAFPDTERSGVYEVLDEEEQILALISVNPSPETAGENLTAEAAADLLAEASLDAEVGDPWPGSILSGRRGREVGAGLLVALLLVLIAETWLASVDRGSLRSTRDGGSSEVDSSPRSGEAAPA